MIVWIGLLALGVAAYMLWERTHGEQSRTSPEQKTALEVLRERYARGEISREEFEERKKTLESS